MNALPSLLDRAPPLPGLALDDLTPDERAQGDGSAAHPCGEFTASRFHALYPERYETIARALAEGFSLEAAARVFRIHERTAAAIREREARSLSAEAYRGIQARHARGVVLAATDEIARRLREAPGEIGVRDLVAAVRELHNVERALEGAPSQVVGVIRADGASAALADLLQQAAEAAQGRADGFGGTGNAAREGERPLVEAPAEVVEVALVDAAHQGSEQPSRAAKGPSLDSKSLTQSAQSPMFAGVSGAVDTVEDAAGAARTASAAGVVVGGEAGVSGASVDVAAREGPGGGGGGARMRGADSTRSVRPGEICFHASRES